MKTVMILLSVMGSVAASCDSSCPSPGCTQCTYPFARFGAQCTTGASCDADNHWAGADYCPAEKECCYCPGAWSIARITNGTLEGCLCA